MKPQENYSDREPISRQRLGVSYIGPVLTLSASARAKRRNKLVRTIKGKTGKAIK